MNAVSPGRPDSSGIWRRILMSISGVVICAVSVGMFKFAAFGVDPFQSLMSGLDCAVPIRFGTLYTIVNAVLLLFALLLDRRKVGIATFLNLSLLGYLAEYIQNLCTELMPDPSFVQRISVFFAAIIILCLSSSLYFTADLGVSPYDAVALIWSQRQGKIRFFFCRVICDLCCVIIGSALLLSFGGGSGALFASVGAGTVITAFFMGPLIQFFNTHVSLPLLGAGKGNS